jgi:two-component system, chemotaxis family, chemotaxis protein CheY
MNSILIADDSLTSRMILMRCLEMAGIKSGEILQAADGKAALEMAVLKGPDLIITDINMPMLDGEALLIAAKAHPRLRNTPILIISSALNPDREKRLVSLGSIGTVRKPVSPMAIRTALAPFFDFGEGK